MKTSIKLVLILLTFTGCVNKQKGVSAVHNSVVSDDGVQINVGNDFASYWYKGKAEITSYKLSEARYGEIRSGHSVLIYVTEQFLPNKQLKANSNSEDNIPVLKLNSTKKYLTGIYPYSVMTSVFSPLNSSEHAIKATFSYQEWCGQTYIQLNNRKKFEVQYHSYFENNGDKKFKLKKNYLENDIWTTIRISPKSLPQGEIKMMPSLEYLGMNHKEIKAYEAIVTMETGKILNSYKITYPELERVLIIRFSKEFPFQIEEWEETYTSNLSNPEVKLTSKGVKIKSITTDYWNKNKVIDTSIRTKLGL